MTPAEIAMYHLLRKTLDRLDELEELLKETVDCLDYAHVFEELTEEIRKAIDYLVDLKTGCINPSDPTKYCTKITNATPDPNAQCPVFLSVLHRAMDGNQDMIDYLQRILFLRHRGEREGSLRQGIFARDWKRLPPDHPA